MTATPRSPPPPLPLPLLPSHHVSRTAICCRSVQLCFRDVLTRARQIRTRKAFQFFHLRHPQVPTTTTMLDGATGCKTWISATIDLRCSWDFVAHLFPSKNLCLSTTCQCLATKTSLPIHSLYITARHSSGPAPLARSPTLPRTLAPSNLILVTAAVASVRTITQGNPICATSPSTARPASKAIC